MGYVMISREAERGKMKRQKRVNSKEEMALVIAADAALHVIGSMPADFDEYHTLAKALAPYAWTLEMKATGICPDCGGSGWTSDGKGSGDLCGFCR